MFSLRHAVNHFESWRRNRALTNRSIPAARLEFSDGAARRVLMITLANQIPQSQIFPLHFWREEIRATWGIEWLELGLDAWLTHPELAPTNPDVVAFQAWIDKSPEEISSIARSLRQRYPQARIAFLDCFAPTDLRYATALNELVDLYVKKHVLRDRTQYGLPTWGHTNLSDWFGEQFAIEQPRTVFEIPQGFLGKLLIGPTFFTAPYLLNRLDAYEHPPSLNRRTIDIHVRLGGLQADGWYGAMRRHCARAVEDLPDSMRKTPISAIRKSAYLREMRQSRLCFSPFGYGEACFRDYEAIVNGAVLVKPDMSHVETAPDVFIPGETYVPVRWDLADLPEQISRYLADDQARERMALAAYQRLRRYVTGGEFLQQMAPLLAP